MNKLSRVIALSLFGLSGSVIAADEESGRGQALAKLDLDGDGSVNFEEFQQNGARGLGRLDNDGNGVLTLDEILNARPGFRGRGDRNADRPEHTPNEEQIARMERIKARITERATAHFQEMDSDGDDVVTPEEFQQARFLELDSDSNGLLSAQELRPKRAGRRGPGGHRGGRPSQA